MPRSQSVVTSFTTGVMSPRLTLRADNPKYSSALQECRNFIITPQGGAVFRQGFERLNETTVPGSRGRLLQFHRGGNRDDDLLEVTPDGNVQVWSAGTLTETLAGHAYSTDEILDEIYFHNQERVGAICHTDSPPFILKMPIGNEWSAAPLPFNLVPYTSYGDDKSPGVAVTSSTYTITVDGTWTDGVIFESSYGGILAFRANEFDLAPFLPIWTSDQDRNAYIIRNSLVRNPYILGSTTVTVTANSLTEYVVTMTGTNAGKELDLRPRSGQSTATIVQDGALSDADEPAWSYPFVVEHNGVYYQCIQAHSTEVDAEPGVGADWQDYWVDLGSTPPAWYDYQHDTDGDGVGDESWTQLIDNRFAVYAPWDRGFPEVCCFHQGRLVFMATKDGPTKIWGSEIGEYENFEPGVNDSDPFVFDLDTSDAPRIKWAESTQDALAIGTSSGDFLMTAEVTLGPTDIQVTKQNGARSEHRRAVVIGTEVYYIEQGREKIRATSYVWNINAWESSDMSMLAENLLHQRVKRIAIMRTPEVIVFGIREDGTMVAFTYIPGNPPGLAFYEFTNPGDIVDIAIQYDYAEGEDVLFATITYDGGDTYYVEKMPYPRRVLPTIDTQAEAESGSLTDLGIIHIDSWQTQEVTAQQLFTFPEYTGFTVRVIVDDAWLGDFEVVDGLLDVGEPISGTMVYGFPYTGFIKTYEQIGGSPRGASFGTRRVWNRLFLRLLDSANPKVNDYLPNDRRPSTSMNIPDILHMGLSDPEWRALQWGDGSVEIKQDRPYPTHVLGLYGEFNVGDT